MVEDEHDDGIQYIHLADCNIEEDDKVKAYFSNALFLKGVSISSDLEAFMTAMEESLTHEGGNPVNLIRIETWTNRSSVIRERQ